MESNVMAVREELNIMAVSALGSYSSVSVETKADKIKVYNAVMNPDIKLGDIINGRLKIKDIMIEKIELTDDQTGEIIVAPRTVILDDKGKSYDAVSVGVFSALKKIISIFGEPQSWDEPLEVKVIQKTIKTNKMLTLEIVG